VALGSSAGRYTQQEKAVALGPYAGQESQQFGAVALGPFAGYDSQQQTAVALGPYAGEYSQQEGAVAVGPYAGQFSQQERAVALGYNAGNTAQGSNAIAIGTLTGQTGQGQYSVSIGFKAGSNPNTINTRQFPYSVCIGNKAWSPNSSSIVINANTTSLAADVSSGFFVNPVRGANTGQQGLNLHSVMLYNPTSKEIIYDNTNSQNKTFVIPHPKNTEKYLVHACLEGPEAGVYYRGKGEITNNHSVTIQLPDYVNKLATDLTVQITPIYNPNQKEKPTTLYASYVTNNAFEVYGENSKFFWLVMGQRASIETEPNKKDVNVEGSGPYKWIE
jgi:hypothetical protein